MFERDSISAPRLVGMCQKRFIPPIAHVIFPFSCAPQYPKDSRYDDFQSKDCFGFKSYVVCGCEDSKVYVWDTSRLAAAGAGGGGAEYGKHDEVRKKFTCKALNDEASSNDEGMVDEDDDDDNSDGDGDGDGPSPIRGTRSSARTPSQVLRGM